MSPAEPSTAKGAATRAHLLTVAASEFAENGYEATKFSALIAASGLTKGAFYFYFSSKAELARAVIDHQEQLWIDVVERRVLAQETPIAQLMEVLPAMLEHLESDPGAWSVIRLVRELGDSGSPHKPIETWITLIANIIRDGQTAGQMRADIDATALATVLVGAFDGIKTLVDAGATEQRDHDLAHYTEVLMSLAAGGLDINLDDINPTGPNHESS
ncbi:MULTISPECIES: TetR/AcrR family transcriptional regulator [unclassified Gordonia (in: high G+C Gram-positive bacteria)]|uniref:TetR/AcrR family transcriptional regulator n=1 Tax=unclassified Gordonia (in: high G+C Gram-positive bacteria) TaxID=2657482 RepID=UPI001F0EDB7A|nr:TetR/AcrR family transcriptional regulator [Gordonia sp. ABSL49_1]MCH5642073.1 TetR/AcrR family transcriptional regulator [Gordonia sp. ABSL49_1]